MKNSNIKTIDNLRLIDDIMFRLAVEDTEFCEELINTLTDSNVTVIESRAQETLVNLHREVTVDVLCRNSDGSLVNVDVQIHREHDDMRRCRYHAASILTNKTAKNTAFADIPDVKIIYISEYDALGSSQTVTRVKRYQKVGNDLFEADDGEEFYFANTTVKDGTRKSELLQLFLSTEAPQDDSFPATADRIRHFKASTEGRYEMNEVLQAAMDEYAKESALFSSIQTAIMYCKRYNKTREDAIKDVASLNEDTPIAEITELVYQNW